MAEFTADEKLNLCNMVSTGTPLKEAKEKVLKARKAVQAGKPAANTKPTTKEKKEAIAAEIKELGGDVPAVGASVAVFQQALTAAKEAAKDAPGEDAPDEDLM